MRCEERKKKLIDFVVHLCAGMLVFGSDSSLSGNAAHQLQVCAEERPNPGPKWRCSIFRAAAIVKVVIIEVE